MTTHKADTHFYLKHGRHLTKRQRQICRKEGLRAIDGRIYRSAGELALLFNCHRDTARYWMSKIRQSCLDQSPDSKRSA